MDAQLLQRLSDKSVTKEALHEAVVADFGLLPELLKGTSFPKASVRYTCGSILLNLSAKNPEKIYPHMDAIIELLDSEYRILVWNALAIIANLCRVDTEGKFDAIFDRYFSFLNNEYMVTVANVVGNSGKIALAKPHLIPGITKELLKVENIALTPHLTEECKRVITQHAIRCFNDFFTKIPSKEQVQVLSFAKRYAQSPRESLKKEAVAFLERWSD